MKDRQTEREQIARLATDAAQCERRCRKWRSHQIRSGQAASDKLFEQLSAASGRRSPLQPFHMMTAAAAGLFVALALLLINLGEPRAL